MPELEEKPLNREPELEQLISSFITCTKNYDRNHSALPALDADTHRVRLDGAVKHPLELSIAALKNTFTQHSVVCALQCAGNRRHTMRTKIKEVQGIDWFDGAVMNCKWTGPRLRDILARAQFSLSEEQQKDAHVAFACNAVPCEDDTYYGVSIPLSRAMREDADVLLALEMNDRPLSVEHGFPVRVIVPGVAGARAVKWLDRITVQNSESENFYQRRDYKILPEAAVDCEAAKQYWDAMPSVQEMPVNSIIAVPGSGSTVVRDVDGMIAIKGYALPSGDGGPVVKVEVSVDKGKTWHETELLSHVDEGRWSWKLWQTRLVVPVGQGKIIYSRATDAAGKSQPAACKWNLRGICYNAYGEANSLTIE
ncbi:Hypothetical protein R9X50_00672300 [Acrodontium crateriforme]|uniref:Sulfite oxidase n=1 Tax=Acrodontium crateriforme TaxID=150365 RepID=A0AAQ3RCB3_9PEZI|nr:Hypothetical protein R9X50_00672300 [Acrodontium crateriforme]